MKLDEVIDGGDIEGDAEGEGDGAHGEDFDLAFDAEGAVETEAIEGCEMDHLGAVEKKLAWGAFVGIDVKLRDGLSAEGGDGFAGHFPGDIVSVDVEDLPGVAKEGGKRLGHGRGLG